MATIAHRLPFLVLPLILAIAGCRPTSGPSSYTYHGDISLAAGERTAVPVQVNRGNVINVSAHVVGDQSVDIGVWLEDETGKVVVKEDRNKLVEFRYGATSSGSYHVIVNNAYSLSTSKVVSLTIKVDK